MADAVVSPLARAIRLGREIRWLREHEDVSQADLARRAGLARTVLSRIESPAGEPHRRADPRHVRATLIALAGENSDRYRELEPLIWDATRDGWWDRRRRMGPGQQVVAAIECGASTIREYQTGLIPGLAQTAAYARYRAEVAAPPTADLDAVTDGRMYRQQQMAKAGTTYQIVIEELALRRLAAPPEVMISQLEHVLQLVEQPRISLRVLPIDARLPAGWAPTLPFSIYSYPDPADPTIVLIDVVGRAPSPMSEPGEIRLYVELFDRLVDAALSDADSVECIKDAVARIGGR